MLVSILCVVLVVVLAFFVIDYLPVSDSRLTQLLKFLTVLCAVVYLLTKVFGIM